MKSVYVYRSINLVQMSEQAKGASSFLSLLLL